MNTLLWARVTGERGPMVGQGAGGGWGMEMWVVLYSRAFMLWDDNS